MSSNGRVQYRSQIQLSKKLTFAEINPSAIPGLILRLRSGQAPGVCSGLILSSAFDPALKAGVWCRRSIK